MYAQCTLCGEVVHVSELDHVDDVNAPVCLVHIASLYEELCEIAGDHREAWIDAMEVTDRAEDGTPLLDLEWPEGAELPWELGEDHSDPAAAASDAA